MSSYFKRSVIASEVKRGYAVSGAFSAIIKFESGFSNGVKISVSHPPINVQNKELKLVIFSSEKQLALPFVKEQVCELEVSEAISCGIFHGDELVCFGSSGTKTLSRTQFCELFLRKKLFSYASTQERVLENVYDDEQIATENYYDNRLIDKDLENNESHKHNKYDETQREFKAQASKEQPCKKTSFNGSNYNANQKQGACEYHPYFDTVQDELTSLFSNNMREVSLECVVPHSKWVRVNHSIDKFYVVGIIEKNGEPQYICYGVPGEFGKPPEKLKEFSSFIPSSLFNLSGSGYFVMFQCAQSGKRLELKTDAFGY